MFLFPIYRFFMYKQFAWFKKAVTYINLNHFLICHLFYWFEDNLFLLVLNGEFDILILMISK